MPFFQELNILGFQCPPVTSVTNFTRMPLVRLVLTMLMINKNFMTLMTLVIKWEYSQGYHDISNKEQKYLRVV